MAMRVHIDNLYPLTKDTGKDAGLKFYCGNAQSLGFEGPCWPYKLEIVGLESTPIVVTTCEIMRGGSLRIYRSNYHGLTVKIDEAYTIREAERVAQN